MSLEERIRVVLYNLKSSGNSILHDTPAIGAYEIVDEWKEEHGIYANKKTAEKERDKFIEKYLAQGYRQFFDYKHEKEEGHLGTSCKDVYIKLEELELDRKEIAVDGKGGMFYLGKTIIE